MYKDMIFEPKLMYAIHDLSVPVLLDVLVHPGLLSQAFQNLDGIIDPVGGDEEMIMEIGADGVTADAGVGEVARQDGQEADGLEARVYGTGDHAARVLVGQAMNRSSVQRRDDGRRWPVFVGRRFLECHDHQ